jgi:hypothetical protein
MANTLGSGFLEKVYENAPPSEMSEWHGLSPPGLRSRSSYGSGRTIAAVIPAQALSVSARDIDPLSVSKPDPIEWEYL